MSHPFTTFIICTLAASVYFYIRNEWVYSQVIKVDEDEDLPSSEAMVFKYFWIWNFEKLCNKK
jgi:hypothetical protein